jgi:hypothetical protein
MRAFRSINISVLVLISGLGGDDRTLADGNLPITKTAEWSLRFNLEDHQVEAGQTNACVVSLKRRGAKEVEVDGVTYFEFFAAKPDGSRGEQIFYADSGKQSPKADQFFPRPRLRLVVQIVGDFPEPLHGSLDVEGALLITHKLHSGQKALLEAAIPASAFQRGSYRLRAVLRDGKTDVVTSKETVAAVSK